MLDTRSVTFNILIINIVLFAISYFIPATGEYLSLHYFFNNNNYVEAINNSHVYADRYPNLAVYAQEAARYGQVGGFLPIQIISHMFMHGSIAHIFFNMYGLFMLGSLLERVWGAKRFLSFYFITGFGAVILHVLVQMFLVYSATGSVDPTMAMLDANPEVWGTYFSQTVGASGAIFGILTGFAVLFPNTELFIMFIPVPVKAKYFVGIYIVIELILGIRMGSGDNVAHFAHLGGALFGFLLVKYWNRNNRSLY